MKLRLVVICILSLQVSVGLNAQETISSSGGEASGEGGSINYSIGQVTYFTLTGTNGYSVAQGVQQPFEISVLSGSEEVNDVHLEAIAFPNPTSDFLILRIDDLDETHYVVSLYDIKGMLLMKNDVRDRETQIDMQKLTPSIYFLKVVKNGTEAKVFKIIKK